SSAPSPAPTDIIPLDLTPDEIIEDIQRMGIKVRDFAYEKVPDEQRAPELFDPVMSWNQYEDALANPDRKSAFSGRSLRRLLDLGWVSEAIDSSRWLKKDRDTLDEFDSRPQYPWKAFNLPQPKKEKLKEAARARLQFVHVGQWPPEVLARGLARIGGFFHHGPASTSEKRPVENNETEQQREGSPQSKKLRLTDGTPAFPAGRRPQSPPCPSRPQNTLGYDSSKQTLAGPSHDDSRVVRNGRPPRQHPAGYPSEVPPRSS
ncbi:hypothetical protein J3A83DRAFT_4046808, partial [Scleroderma citrinum]